MAQSTSDFGVRSNLGSSTLSSAALPSQTSKLTTAPRTITMGQSSGDSYISQSPAPEEKNIRYTLPNDDHIYANCGETMRFRELASEVENLKSLLLLHLDLIQQQSECIALKDKHLTTLRQENETLKMRIERMERRISLQLQRQRSEPPEQENVPAPSDNNNKSNPEPTLDKKPSGTPNHTAAQSNDVVTPVPRKRIKTLLPVKSPASKRNSRDADRSTQRGKLKTDDSEGHIVKLENHKDDFSMSMDVENTVEIHDSPSNIQVAGETPSLPSATKSPKGRLRELSPLSVLPEHRRIQKLLQQKFSLKEPPMLQKGNILITDEPYATLVGENLQNNDLNETFEEQIEIEVPLWCESSLEPVKDCQGVENLDDEVFAKRHQKHELDEKRRKRWDLQRAREQRQYEKLRARYEGEDRSQDRSSNKTRNHSATISSFWPQPQDVSHVHIDNWLPVNAFGAPLPMTSTSDFSLPWTFNTKGAKGDKRKAQRR